MTSPYRPELREVPQEERTCEKCREEDDYLLYHRFDPPVRECGKCIAEKAMANVRARLST
jgi:hypothetical protein